MTRHDMPLCFHAVIMFHLVCCFRTEPQFNKSTFGIALPWPHESWGLGEDIIKRLEL